MFFFCKHSQVLNSFRQQYMCFTFSIIVWFFSLEGSSATNTTTTSTVTASTTTSSTGKPPRPKWLHCNNCKLPFGNAWDLMVHVQTAHMMNIYQLADTTKLQNVIIILKSIQKTIQITIVRIRLSNLFFYEIIKILNKRFSYEYFKIILVNNCIYFWYLLL